MENIKLLDLLAVALRRIWLLILAFVVCAIGGFCVCEFALTPVYSSKAAIIVNNGGIISTEYITSGIDGKNSVANTDIAASLSLAETITDILKTPDIYKQLVTELEGDYTFGQLKGAISVSRRSSQSLFVDVRASHTNPQEAMRIANAFVHIASEYIPDFIPNSIAVVAEESVSASQVYPQTFMVAAFSGIVGLLIVFIIVYIIDMRNDVVSSDDDFVLQYKIPLLGIVPDFEDVIKTKKKRGYSRGK